MAKIMVIEFDENESVEDVLNGLLQNKTHSLSTAGNSKFKDDEQLLSVSDVMEYLHIGNDF